MTEKGRSPEASARRKAKRDAKAPAPPQGTQNDKFPAAAPPHSASTLERTASANCDHRQEREISAGIPQGTQTAREFGDEDFQQAREWVLARYPDFERNADVANKLTFYLMAVYASSRVASLQQELERTAQELADEYSADKQIQEIIAKQQADFSTLTEELEVERLRSMVLHGQMRDARADRDNQLKYAHLAIGGNPSIQLDDKIRALREVARELGTQLPRDIQSHAEDASKWIFAEKYNNAAIEIQNILKLARAALEKFSDWEKGGGRG